MRNLQKLLIKFFAIFSLANLVKSQFYVQPFRPAFPQYFLQSIFTQPRPIAAQFNPTRTQQTNPNLNNIKIYHSGNIADNVHSFNNGRVDVNSIRLRNSNDYSDKSSVNGILAIVGGSSTSFGSSNGGRAVSNSIEIGRGVFDNVDIRLVGNTANGVYSHGQGRISANSVHLGS